MKPYYITALLVLLCLNVFSQDIQFKIGNQVRAQVIGKPIIFGDDDNRCMIFVSGDINTSTLVGRINKKLEMTYEILYAPGPENMDKKKIFLIRHIQTEDGLISFFKAEHPTDGKFIIYQSKLRKNGEWAYTMRPIDTLNRDEMRIGVSIGLSADSQRIFLAHYNLPASRPDKRILSFHLFDIDLKMLLNQEIELTNFDLYNPSYLNYATDKNNNIAIAAFFNNPRSSTRAKRVIWIYNYSKKLLTEMHLPSNIKAARASIVFDQEGNTYIAGNCKNQTDGIFVLKLDLNTATFTNQYILNHKSDLPVNCYKDRKTFSFTNAFVYKGQLTLIAQCLNSEQNRTIVFRLDGNGKLINAIDVLSSDYNFPEFFFLNNTINYICSNHQKAFKNQDTYKNVTLSNKSSVVFGEINCETGKTKATLLLDAQNKYNGIFIAISKTGSSYLVAAVSGIISMNFIELKYKIE